MCVLFCLQIVYLCRIYAVVIFKLRIISCKKANRVRFKCAQIKFWFVCPYNVVAQLILIWGKHQYSLNYTCYGCHMRVLSIMWRSARIWAETQPSSEISQFMSRTQTWNFVCHHRSFRYGNTCDSRTISLPRNLSFFIRMDQNIKTISRPLLTYTTYSVVSFRLIIKCISSGNKW